MWKKNSSFGFGIGIVWISVLVSASIWWNRNVGIFRYRPNLGFGCSLLVIINYTIIQWKPLNVITLGQSERDNIIWMITISESPSPIKYHTESDLGLGISWSIWSHLPKDNIISDYIKQLPLYFYTIIT
jgi:hypothetical protein